MLNPELHVWVVKSIARNRFDANTLRRFGDDMESVAMLALVELDDADKSLMPIVIYRRMVDFLRVETSRQCEPIVADVAEYAENDSRCGFDLVCDVLSTMVATGCVNSVELDVFELVHQIGLSLTDCAERIGLSLSRVSRINTGLIAKLQSSLLMAR